MKDLILGCHLLFAREGETIDAVVVSADAKPDTTPSTNYTAFPTVEDWEPKVDRQFVERRRPSPGTYQTRKKIPLRTTTTHAFSLQEFTMLTLAELLLGGNKPVSGVFVPGERSELLRGWWIVQGYDQLNDEIVALNIWGEARIDSYKFGERLDPYAVIIEQLYSPLNTGLISNLT
jgi:hypothetical protein